MIARYDLHTQSNGDGLLWVSCYDDVVEEPDPEPEEEETKEPDPIPEPEEEEEIDPGFEPDPFVVAALTDIAN